MKIEMNETRGEFLVGLALALRGTSLLFSKVALRTMGPLLLLGTRFLIAFGLIGILFFKVIAHPSKKDLLYSALIGLLLFMSIELELIGLKTTDSSVTSFLEASIVVMVPILTSVLTRTLPDRMTVVTSITAMVGVALLTLKGGHIGFTHGELLILAGSFMYSCCVLVMDAAAKKCNDKAVAIYQLLFIGLFSMIAACILETPRLPESSAEWVSILALAIICSGVGFTIQPIGQKYTTPERAGLMTVCNPLTASVLGILVLHEKITIGFVAGAVLLIAATGPLSSFRTRFLDQSCLELRSTFT